MEIIQQTSIETNTFRQLIAAIGPGTMNNTVYDTAWAARLIDYDVEMSNTALRWICEQQLPDGSWGARAPFYYYDRVICTLAAITVLARRGRRASDRRQIEMGQNALEWITSAVTSSLRRNTNGATVGFELIAPTLVAEAIELGILRQQGDSILGKLAHKRSAKLAAINGYKINRHMTPVFSAEMAGHDAKQLLDLDNLQEVNGSLGHSPSATAYYALSVKPGDEKALDYLRQIRSHDGGIPDVAPFDIFEPAWILWNYALTDNQDAEILSLCQRHLEHIQSAWKPGRGIATWTAEYTPQDGDDTGLVFDVMARFGRFLDLEGLTCYEEQDHYRCFAMEADPSISTNIHILGGLRQAGFDVNHPLVQKAIGFLLRNQTPDGFWFDKWHASPFYSTAHAIIACAGFDNDLIRSAVDWIIRQQHEDGSWGFSISTAEETAYALQALTIWKRYGGKVPDETLASGLRWLEDHQEPPYPPLWIGKCLYSPVLVVRSAILSAIELVVTGC